MVVVEEDVTVSMVAAAGIVVVLATAFERESPPSGLVSGAEVSSRVEGAKAGE